MCQEADVVKTSITLNRGVRDFVYTLGSVTVSDFINDLGLAYIHNGSLEEVKKKYPTALPGKKININLSMTSNNRFPKLKVFEGHGEIIFCEESKFVEDQYGSKKALMTLLIKVFKGSDDQLMLLHIPILYIDYSEGSLKICGVSTIKEYANLDALGDDIDRDPENHILGNLEESEIIKISENYYQNRGLNLKWLKNKDSIYELNNGNSYKLY